MAVTVTIGGVAKDIKARTLHISRTANGRATAKFAVESTDGSYRPAHDAVVVISDGGSPIFGGLVENPTERGSVEGKGVPAIITTVSCVDYHAYTERRFVNETLAAGTLKSQLQTIVTTYLATYGISLDAGQVNGPTFPAIPFAYTRADEALNRLMAVTADFGAPYVWRINASKVLKAFQPSSEAAPFNLTGDPILQVRGDITIDLSRQHYANKIILLVPTQSQVEREETFTGDGSTTVFTPQFTPTKTYGYLTNNGVYETLQYASDPPSATWTFDPDANTVTRTTAPANGATIIFKFDGTYDGTAIASDAAEIAAHGIWERVVTVESVPSDTTAQALADGYLAKALYATKTVKYHTRESGLAPGQSQTINVSRRNVNATAVITDIETRELGDGEGLIHAVTAVIDSAQTNLDRGWRDTYRVWAGDKLGAGSASSPITVGSGSPVSVGPGGPNRAVQFNDSGVFGGDDAFIYYKTENSVVCSGGGGSSITATTFESSQVFGYDCHIADP